MKTNTQHAFVNQLLIGTLVVFVLGGGAGLGTVWLRHQISITANSTLRAEQQIAEIERSLAEVNTRIASEQSPDTLERRNRNLRLDLAFPASDRIVRVSEPVEQILARKRNQELFNSDTAATARGLDSVRFTVDPADARAGVPRNTTPDNGGGITPVRRQ
ncbi:hypothetical protein Ga0100231_017200 [Opitutaceae bacterium TAV4]|uniref:hypothetical protein n=1 Tax=Geminisphaera colitermitum TaxID=1148786 RepID=UPI000158DFF8|nr:hypothetical protein [Geminisphaera colitermitum]RRJ95756.1 hypothetical protein Ga0100231_017200 [Opitutaceae bacterium TAV4]RRJ99722.1 hypothetical protein Ga0100230_016735 [Opitutaceae bacterium TAV3]